MKTYTEEQEAFRVWALDRMRVQSEDANKGPPFGDSIAVAVCAELWAAMDFVMELGVADWNARKKT